MPRRLPQHAGFTALLRRQRGVFTLAQWRWSGRTDDALESLVRGGRYQRLLPRVYLAGDASPDREQLIQAALLYAGDGAVIDGLDALPYLGLRVRDHPDDIVRVAVDAMSTARSRTYVRLRHTTSPLHTARGQRLPVLAAASAIVAACLELDDLRAVRALVTEAAQREIVTVAELDDAFALAPRRGSYHLRRALEDVRAGTASAPEAEFRRLVLASMLPEPLWNPRLRLPDGSVVSPDAYWEEAALVHEVDSVAYHGFAEARDATMRRHTRMTAAGLMLLHNAPLRIRVEGPVVLAEVEAAYAVGARRGPAPAVLLLTP